MDKKPFQLANRTFNGSDLTIEYSFCTIKTMIKWDDTPSRTMNVYDNSGNDLFQISSEAITEYEAVALISGIEALAEEAFKRYKKRLDDRLNHVNELLYSLKS